MVLLWVYITYKKSQEGNLKIPAFKDSEWEVTSEKIVREGGKIFVRTTTTIPVDCQLYISAFNSLKSKCSSYDKQKTNERELGEGMKEVVAEIEVDDINLLLLASIKQNLRYIANREELIDK